MRGSCVRSRASATANSLLSWIISSWKASSWFPGRFAKKDEPVRLHVEEAFHGERHVVGINYVYEESIRRPENGALYTSLECGGISVGEELPETSSDQLVGRDFEKRGDCRIAPPDAAVRGRHDEMDELSRCKVTGQQGSRVGSEFGEVRRPSRVMEAIENQNLRE